MYIVRDGLLLAIYFIHS